MTLLLTRQDLDGILDMEAAIDATRAMVIEEVEGSVLHMPAFGGSGGPRWVMRVVGGALYGVGRLGMRAGSLSLLFDTETDAPLAIMDLPALDLRLAASVGLGARYLARSDVQRVGLIGSGKIALGILQGLCAVRKIDAVDVYSRTPAHCRAFAARAEQALGIPVVAHDDPEAIIADADILATGTNSRAPVVSYEQIRPGTHVTSSGLAMELDASVYLRADQVVVASRQQEIANSLPTYAPGRVTGGVLHDLLSSGALQPEALVQLGDVARGAVAPRNGPKDINVYRDSRGGLSDAALVSCAYDRARERGLGVEFAFR